jgi:ribosome-associated protein
LEARVGRVATRFLGATVAPKKRVATRPTRASKERRLVGKQKRGEVKRTRGRDWGRE